MRLLCSLTVLALLVAAEAVPKVKRLTPSRTFINIPLDPVEVDQMWERQERERRASGGGQERACYRIRELKKSQLKNPPGFEDEIVLWEPDRVKVYRSRLVTKGINELLALSVPGLDGDTVDDVLQTFRDNGCLTYILGGAVRDQFIGRKPHDADVDLSCWYDKAYNICLSTWGESNCNWQPGWYTLGLGNDDYVGTTNKMDLSNWFIILGEPDTLEFTANSMAYDLNGNRAIIDLSGTGVEDACNMVIRIPSDDGSLESWEAWDKSDWKLYRYWKLRSKNFVAADQATSDFFVRRAIEYATEDSTNFSKFYCKKAQYGSYKPENKCEFTYENCCDAVEAAHKYDPKFIEDFGDHWKTLFEPVIADLVCKHEDPE